MKRTAFFLIAALWLSRPVTLSAQSNFWTPATESQAEKTNVNRKIIPANYRVFRLNINALEKDLADAPDRFSTNANKTAKSISFPLPDGKSLAFRVVRADVLHPDLAARYPGIHAYAGYGIDDPSAFIRFDITPKGFHAVIYSAHFSSVYIDPYMNGNRGLYSVYYTKDYHKTEVTPFECGVGDIPQPQKHSGKHNVTNLEKTTIGDCTLRKYRLALACTGEYAQYHGGTVAQALAAMNTTMTRVNGVYERDASITMEIIPNNDEIIFLDGNSDPYTNNDGSAMLGQNQTTINNIIGTQNYDIGHVFSTGGGGIAYLESPCTSNNKAKGVTGQNSPEGDFFDIDYVAHEMGHQFGGNHTQNNDCNNNPNYSAVEPGSASTIMGYAGICAPDVQPHSDDYFHVFNLREIGDFVTGAGSTCAEEIPTGNHAPTADAGGNHTIPISTPFELTGIGTDADASNVLTYCWEEMDAEVAVMPPSSTSNIGPAFRSYTPTTSPTRIFPPIANIVNNMPSTWNVLPSVGRTMDFTLSVRDNYFEGGCVATDDIRLTFSANAGPFLVTAPNTNVEWHAESNQTVTWDVANTNQSPVNCQNVDIFLSTDGGYTYPITLATDVPNTGSASVVVPNVLGTQNRVKVKGANNVFFDISDENFTISEPLTPDFQLTITPGIVDICAGESANFGLEIVTFVNFSEEMSFSVSGLPEGTSATFAPNTLSGNGSVQLNITGFEDTPAGSYDLEITATTNSVVKSEFVTINLTNSAPAIILLQSPVSGAVNVARPVLIEWQADENAVNYQVQMATSPTFEAPSIIYDQQSSANQLSITDLDPLQVYYWRVKGVNNCGEGIYGTPFSFQTQGVTCKNYFTLESLDITSSGTPTITSIIEVNDPGSIVGISIQELSILHSWVGDLDATLTSPSGTIIQLFDRPGSPASQYGCDGDDIFVDFSSDADFSANDFENSCNAASPAIEGIYQPITPFSQLIEEEMQGEWALTISDHEDNDGGQMETWGMEICYALNSPTSINLSQNTLVVFQGESGVIDNNYLSADANGQSNDDLLYVIVSLPESGFLSRNGTPIAIGESFTQTDVNAGLVEYTHDNSMTTTDVFMFDLFGSGNSWSGNHAFNIIIEERVLSATLNISTEIDCYGNASGGVSVLTENGEAPFMYRLNDGNFQPENTFNLLPAGNYSVTVRDNTGAEATTNTVTLNNPNEIVASNTVSGSQINVEASGGTGTLSYSLNGEAFQSDPLFSDVPVGEFTITVMDENGCTTTTEGSIIDTSLSATATIEQAISCFDYQNGIIAIMSSGGTPPFEYSMNGSDFQESNLFDGLGAGDYSFIVKDANNITFTTPAVSLSNPAPLTLDVNIDGNSVTATGIGGTGSLQYAIGDEAFTDNNTFSDLDNGDYILRVQDENGCETSSNITINIIVSAGVGTGIISCNGESDGSITITNVEGGFAPYFYQLEDGDFQKDNTFSNLSAGTYHITIKDSNDQYYTLEVALGNPEPIVITPILDGNQLTIEATGSGDFQYSIDNGATFSSQNVFTDLPNGVYDIVVVNGNDCTAQAQVTINNITNFLYETFYPWCQWAEASGVISISAVEGGTPPYSYSIDGGDFQESNIFENVFVTETHTIGIMDSEGHFFEQTVMFADAVGLDINPVFDGQNLSIEVSPSGDYLISIDGGNTFSTETFYPDIPSGTYTIVVEDENGCQEMTVFTIDAVNNFEEEGELLLFPNPNTGDFTIQLTHPTRLEVQINIYDVLGRNIMYYSTDKAKESIIIPLSLKDIPSGTYWVKIHNDDFYITKRLIVL